MGRRAIRGRRSNCRIAHLESFHDQTLLHQIERLRFFDLSSFTSFDSLLFPLAALLCRIQQRYRRLWLLALTDGTETGSVYEHHPKTTSSHVILVVGKVFAESTLGIFCLFESIQLERNLARKMHCVLDSPWSQQALIGLHRPRASLRLCWLLRSLTRGFLWRCSELVLV